MSEQQGTSERFDVVVMGAGPGGYRTAIRAAQLGKRVAVVERDRVGGVCLNRGCIPTKALLRTAEVLDNFRHAADFGIDVQGVSLNLAKTMTRKDRIVRRLTGGVSTLLKANGVTLINGTARLVSPTRVTVTGGGGERELEAGAAIIATGSEAALPPIPGIDGRGVITSDGALQVTTVPSSLLIIGAGAVGIEWASVFNGFGSQVTVVEMLPQVVPTEDTEIAGVVESSMARRGVRFHKGTRVLSISDGPGGGKQVTVEGTGGRQVLEAELVLVAAGRSPNSKGIGLEELGVETVRGFIKTDRYMRTNVPNVYAIGDVVAGSPLLAHVAYAEAMVAAQAIAGEDTPIDYRVVPACTFCHPEIASVGLNERQAREQGLEIKVGRFPFLASGKALAFGDTTGMVKIIAGARYGEVLGVHIVGPGASDLIAEGALAIRLEATLEDVAETIHAHPTLPEAVEEAALDAMARALEIPPRR